MVNFIRFAGYPRSSVKRELLRELPMGRRLFSDAYGLLRKYRGLFTMVGYFLVCVALATILLYTTGCTTADAMHVVIDSGGYTVSLAKHGEYDGAHTYEANDLVVYSGSSYICHTSSLNNLPTDTDYFYLFAEKGAIGDTGATGAQGIQGETGATGDSGISVGTSAPANPETGDLWLDTN